MTQPQNATPPVNRMIRWRYSSAVQAARVLSSIGREREQPRPEPARAEVRPSRVDALSR